MRAHLISSLCDDNILTCLKLLSQNSVPIFSVLKGGELSDSLVADRLPLVRYLWPALAENCSDRLHVGKYLFGLRTVFMTYLGRELVPVPNPNGCFPPAAAGSHDVI